MSNQLGPLWSLATSQRHQNPQTPTPHDPTQATPATSTPDGFNIGEQDQPISLFTQSQRGLPRGPLARRSPTPDSPPPYGPAERHYIYYEEQDLFHMRAGDQLFRFPVNWITDISEPLKLLANVNPENSKEGKSDRYPIFLPDAPEEWAAYLSWRTRTNPPDTTEQWRHLLNISHKYCMEEPKADAILALEKIGDFPLSTKLQLCSQYRITSWFLPTLSAFLAIPNKDYTPEDFINLGEKMHGIIQLKGALDYFYKELLSNTFEVLHLCDTSEEEDCQADWNAFFNEIIALMCHPDQPIRGIEAEKVLQAKTEDCRLCFRMGRDSIVDKGILVQDREILIAGVGAIAESFGFAAAEFPDIE
ncbi:hypothetical protein SISNIDRAFT_490357 [Sistotremastrum niveocremeum HHB9708]|uniref:BTB domain-containing protein n=1 Tax=Sistotremastrum niveocremeum HHB9708 TaxID=1314777 RepID=A0A164NYM1_9AGAM|nr:hypothetical protein SISNIDRAFT_490357 [Sistotremastrum niveocremeum HHB9708]